MKMSKLKDLPKPYHNDETKGDMSHRVRRSPSLLKMLMVFGENVKMKKLPKLYA